MSDQQDKNIEQVAEETAASDGGAEASEAHDMDDAPAPARVVAPAPRPATAPAAPRGSSAIAWLALLLVLVLAAGGGWYVWEQQRVDGAMAQRLEKVEAIAGRDEASLDELASRWQGRLNATVTEFNSGIGEVAGETSRLGQSIGALQAQLQEQRGELDRYSANDRKTWLLAEVEYLLRLANQRLIMAGDVAAAQALLGSADNILLELDDASLHGVRAAVAADLAAVRAVPTVDVEGIYLRLAALVEQADKLRIFQLPEREERLSPEAATDWRARLRQGYEAALAKLSDYIIIRRRDVPMQALMDPQWEGLVRQNLRMLLEQAQVALLSGNQTLYQESLRRAQHWLGEFFESDEAAARAMSGEVGQLVDLTVAVTVPDVARSLGALDEVMTRRLQTGGEE